MARKCKECPEKEKIKEVKTKKEKVFSFPWLWIKIQAKNLEEATKKVKALTEYKNKSL